MPAAPDRRSDLRFICNGTIRVDHPEADAIQPGRILDLSLGGCLVLVAHPEDFSEGDPIELTILVKGTPFRVRGLARRGRRRDHLLGIQFRTMTAGARTNLTLLIEELEAELANHTAAAV